MVATTPQLPEDDSRVSVVVDAMYLIRRWSFLKIESFGAIPEKYLHLLLSDIPINTHSIHFCCDRYSGNLKEAEQEKRYLKSKVTKVYEVREQYIAPDPKELFAVSKNKANLLQFLCEEWCQREHLRSILRTKHLFLSGGFQEETKSVVIRDNAVKSVPELESTQKEADTRIILHSMFAFKTEDTERIINKANDTDVVTLCIYYAATYLKDLPELWVQTDKNTFLPVHEMSATLGLEICGALPFIHSLSGRGTTSYPYFTGKKAWFQAS